jgi:hypothetical protein
MNYNMNYTEYFAHQKNNKLILFDLSDYHTREILIYLYSLLNFSKADKTYFFTNANKMICEEMHKLVNKIPSCCDSNCSITQQEHTKWKLCIGKCHHQLTTLINYEITSTAYYLRLFINSIIYLPQNQNISKLSLRIEYQNTINEEQFGNHRMTINPLYRGSESSTDNPIESLNLTGKWDHDKHRIKIIGVEKKNIGGGNKNRLIMGFGPSASGKTYLTSLMIKLFQQVFPQFPEIFISVDGGIIRDVSVIFRMIVEQAKNHMAGISNLIVTATSKINAGISQLKRHVSKVSANMSQSSFDLFPSSEIKKHFIEYLGTKYSGNISLYVPDTISSCSLINFENCQKVVLPYITITGDNNWIGLLIWQHKYVKDCNKTIKCIGTVELGTKRAISEGKKYSDIGWHSSMANGYYMLSHAKIRLSIHNSGYTKIKSIIEDLSEIKLNIKENPNFIYCTGKDCGNEPLQIKKIKKITNLLDTSSVV